MTVEITLRQPGGSPERDPSRGTADPKGAIGTHGALISSVVTAESAVPDVAEQRSGLPLVYLGDHWAWRTGYSPAALAWSTQHPPGSRSVLNRD